MDGLTSNAEVESYETCGVNILFLLIPQLMLISGEWEVNRKTHISCDTSKTSY